jgi:hypothetical protein
VRSGAASPHAHDPPYSHECNEERFPNGIRALFRDWFRSPAGCLTRSMSGGPSWSAHLSELSPGSAPQAGVLQGVLLVSNLAERGDRCRDARSSSWLRR